MILQDLACEEMSIVEAEKRIKAFADGNKKGNASCVTPPEADRILREFYGLPEAPEARCGQAGGAPEPFLNLLDFLG